MTRLSRRLAGVGLSALAATLVASLLLLSAAATAQPKPVEDRPVEVFAALDGTWQGHFVGYDATGKELYRIKARHSYRTVDAVRQEARIADTMPDGTVITGQGYNIAKRQPDGSLSLLCVIEKSDGDRVEHHGTVSRGPDGVQQIVWFTDTPNRHEVFRELVRRVDGRWVYTIDGFGRYGDSVTVMAGRYGRVE
ncbi:MAG: hypothetical protein AAF560_15205 [Acidobacteriota bacterium]